MAQPEMHTRLPWSEVVGGPRLTIEAFREALRQFPRSAILKTCCRISILFRFGPNANTTASEELSAFWAPHVFDARFLPAVMSAIKRKRPIFFQGQLRFIAAEAMRLDCVPEDGTSALPDKTIGPLLLGAAEMLYKKPAANLQDDFDSMANLVAIFLPLYEIDQLTDPIISYIRFYIFVTVMPDRLPEHIRRLFDVPALFEAEFGFPLKLYSQFVFAFTTHAMNERVTLPSGQVPEGGLAINWFTNTVLTSAQISAMFDTVSCTLDELPDNKPTHGYADFEYLRDHPYLRMSDKVYSLDYEFAVAKLESGVLWRVAKSMPTNRRLSYFSYWGEIFESYVAWLFEEYADKEHNVYHPSPKLLDGSNQPLCDAIVMCGRTAVLIEAKMATCPASVRYSVDYKKIRGFLEQKLVVGTDRKVGVSQLHAAFEHITLKQESALPPYLHGIRTFIPLIITRDDIGSSWMTNGYLKRRFGDGVSRRTRKRFKIKPLVSMSVSTLERLLAALSKMALSDILEERMKDDRSLQKPFEMASSYGHRGTPANLFKHYEIAEALTDQMVDEFGMLKPTDSE